MTASESDTVSGTAKKIEKGTDQLSDILRALQGIMPDLRQILVGTGWQTTIKFCFVAVGGIAVLGLCYYADQKENGWWLKKSRSPCSRFLAGFWPVKKLSRTQRGNYPFSPMVAPRFDPSRLTVHLTIHASRRASPGNTDNPGIRYIAVFGDERDAQGKRLSDNQAVEWVGVGKGKARCPDGGIESGGQDREAAEGRRKPIGGPSGNANFAFIQETAQLNHAMR